MYVTGWPENGNGNSGQSSIQGSRIKRNAKGGISVGPAVETHTPLHEPEQVEG
jgi:hypothetical protein